MKKISALIITLVFVLTLSACALPTNSGVNGNEQATATITADEALDIALKEAGVTKENITKLRNELDRDDGVLIYEIEFDSAGKEYSYDVNAQTGEIRERDVDIAD